MNNKFKNNKKKNNNNSQNENQNNKKSQKQRRGRWFEGMAIMYGANTSELKQKFGGLTQGEVNLWM